MNCWSNLNLYRGICIWHLSVDFQQDITSRVGKFVLSRMWNESRQYVTWLDNMWHDSTILTTYPMTIYDMTLQYVTWLDNIWYDSTICDMTRQYLLPTQWQHVTWLDNMWHDSTILATPTNSPTHQLTNPPTHHLNMCYVITSHIVEFVGVAIRVEFVVSTFSGICRINYRVA